MADGQANTSPEHMARARRSADVGDVSHTVLHSQEALFGAVGRLTEEIGALRQELAARRANG